MKEIGGCHICGKKANQSCSICGSLVCDEHMHRGVCIECRKGPNKKEKPERNISKEDLYS